MSRATSPSSPTPSGQLTFTHDAEGRLLSVDDPDTGTPVASYTYDALGRCSRARGGGLPPSRPSSSTTATLHPGTRRRRHRHGASTPALTFVAAGGIRHCISTRNGTYFYPHGGGAGPSMLGKEKKRPGRESPSRPSHSRVAGVTDQAGTLLECFDCDDAGKPIFLSAAGLPTTDTASTTGLRLTEYKFPGDDTPIVRGSALKALERSSTDPNAPEYACIKELLDVVDNYFPSRRVKWTSPS